MKMKIAKNKRYRFFGKAHKQGSHSRFHNTHRANSHGEADEKANNDEKHDEFFGIREVWELTQEKGYKSSDGTTD